MHGPAYAGYGFVHIPYLRGLRFPLLVGLCRDASQRQQLGGDLCPIYVFSQRQQLGGGLCLHYVFFISVGMRIPSSTRTLHITPPLGGRTRHPRPVTYHTHTLLWDGRRRVGKWQNGKLHGNGKDTWTDGRKYSGQYQCGEEHGFGTSVWEDGERHEGFWQRGDRLGYGTLFTTAGDKLYALWADDELVQEATQCNSSKTGLMHSVTP